VQDSNHIAKVLGKISVIARFKGNVPAFVETANAAGSIGSYLDILLTQNYSDTD
jgi:hypothetical protein